MTPPPGDFRITRRELLVGGVTFATVMLLPSGVAEAKAEELAQLTELSSQELAARGMSRVSLTVNGKVQEALVDNRVTLLDLLREGLQLTGSKKGCDHGQCGACTLMVNGERINSCLTLAVMHEGDEVTTIEGLGSPEELHPMQAAFIKYDGYQCGYCTPGQICSAVAVLHEIKAGVPSHVQKDVSVAPVATALEIRERMSGNLCRCGAYSNIIEAILEQQEVSA